MRSGSRCPAFYGEIPPMRWGILDDDGGYFYCITYTLDAILATTAEQEDRQLVRIQMESRDNQGAKPVDGLPHIRIAASQIDVFRHEFSDWHAGNTSRRTQSVLIISSHFFSDS